MEAVVARSALNDAPDRKSVSMMNKDHRHALREVTFEFDIIHAVRMYVGAHQCTNVRDIDKPEANLRNVFSKQPSRRHRLGGRYISRTGQNHIRLCASI